MKHLNLLVRFIIVGAIWSVLFVILWRSIVYEVWGFDIAFNKHWVFLWQMWKDGWVIDTLSEWCFFLAIFLFIPVWLLGWLALANIAWGAILFNLCVCAINYLKTVHKKYFAPRVLVITRKKSYLKTRPPALSYVMPVKRKTKKYAKKRKDGKDDDKMLQKVQELSGKKSRKKFKGATYTPDIDEIMADDSGIGDVSEEPRKISLAKDVDTDINSLGKDNPFDVSPDELLKSFRSSNTNSENSANDEMDEFESRRVEATPAWNYEAPRQAPISLMTEEEKKQVREQVISDIGDTLKMKGYTVFKDVRVGDDTISFLGVAKDNIVTCMVDMEEGDWLADEESFNDEDPLWFSEKSHRKSPVKRLNDAMLFIKQKIGLADSFGNDNILAIEAGKVINSSDMEEIWDGLGVKVCRVGNGQPVELPHFMDIIPDKVEKADDTLVDKFKEVLAKAK